MGGRPVVAVNLLGWPREVLPFELAAEVLRGGLDVLQRSRLPSRRRAQRRRPGAEVRAGGHGRRRPGPPAAQRRRQAGHAAVADQAARHRRAQQPAQGHRRGLPAGGRGDDDAQPGRRARPRWPRVSNAPPTSPGFGLLGHLHKLARASGVTAVDRLAGGALPRRGPRGAAGRIRQRRHPAQPRLGARRTSTSPPSTTTKRCCSPTRRPPAACWSPARFPARPSSASWCRAGEHTIVVR